MAASKPGLTAVTGETLPAYKCGHYGHKSKRTGRPCGQNVLKGTEHCRNHAGRPVAEAKARGAIRIEYTQWQLSGHDGSSIDPRVEILRLIAFWRWKADFYGAKLQEAYEAAERLQARHRAGEIVLAEPESDYRAGPDGEDLEIPEHPALQVARMDLERIFTHGGVAALVGEKHDADRDGRIYATDEGIRGLVLLEQKAHEMVGKFCSLAVQAKVAEHQIQLAQEAGLMIQAVILGVLRDLNVAPSDLQVQSLIAFHIDQAVSRPMLAA